MASSTPTRSGTPASPKRRSAPRRPAGRKQSGAGLPAAAAEAAQAAKPERLEKPEKPAKPRGASKPAKAASASEPAKPKGAASKARAPKPAAAAKPERVKLVRDSFTMPKSDIDLLAALKQRCLKLGHEAKKSELLRAGLHALAALQDEALVAAVSSVPRLKTGRPGQRKSK